MKAKYNHCTNRLFACLAVMCLAASGPIKAQQSRVMNPYERVVRGNFWMSESNPAGIRQDTTLHSAYAEIYGKGAYNGFRNSSEAQSPWNVGAKTEALTHLRKFSMAGHFGFEQDWVGSSSGAMFSGCYPLNFYEFTPGMKTRQTYSVGGRISVDVAPLWRLGAGIDFRSSNRAKIKDIRYTDYSLEFEFTPGVVYCGKGFSIGLNYILGKNSETVTAEQVGTKQPEYYAFIDKGLYYGKYELWTGSGVHLSEAGVSGTPLREVSNGVAFQLQATRFFLGFEYLHSSGKAGEKQSIWYRFPSDQFSLRLGDVFESKGFEHRFELSANIKNQRNNETILEKVTENGVTTTREYGSNQILQRKAANAELEYSLSDGRHTLDVVLGTDESVSTASQMYPLVIREDLAQWYASVGGTAQIKRFTLHLGLGYRGGSLHSDQSLENEESGVESSLFRLEDVYRTDMEYMTAHRLSGALALRYDIYKGLYIQLEANAVGAFGLKTIKTGAARVEASLRVGYNF